MQQTKKGFTLIELLVVIAIIGILSAIGLVSLNGAREKARDAQRKSDIAQMNTALALYYDDNNNTYPPQVNGTILTKVDCIKAGNPATTVDVTGAGAYGGEAAAPANQIWASTGGVMIPTYVSRQLAPPSGGSGWQSVYCYDTNDTAAAPNTSYVLYGGLEGVQGTTFFAVRANGTNVNTQPGLCKAQTATVGC